MKWTVTAVTDRTRLSLTVPWGVRASYLVSTIREAIKEKFSSDTYSKNIPNWAG